jgi:hypothetical protein
MSAIILDTLNFADKLKAGGFTDQQAEAQTRAFAEVMEKQLTTRQDIDAHETSIKRDIQESENRLEIKIKELEIKINESENRLELKIAETNVRIAETKSELIRWVVAVGVLQSTLIVGVLLKVARLI